jgi:hypothetical protein
VRCAGKQVADGIVTAVALRAAAPTHPHRLRMTIAPASGATATLYFGSSCFVLLGFWRVCFAGLLFASAVLAGPCWQHRDHERSGIFLLCAECSQI